MRFAGAYKAGRRDWGGLGIDQGGRWTGSRGRGRSQDSDDGWRAILDAWAPCGDDQGMRAKGAEGHAEVLIDGPERQVLAWGVAVAIVESSLAAVR